MAPGVTVKATFDFKLMAKRTPQLVADALNDISDVLRDDMKQGAAQGVDVGGKAFDKLQPMTIRAKRRKGSGTSKMPLIDTNRMIGVGAERGRIGIFVQKRAKPGSLNSRITIPKNRQVPGVSHNDGLGNNPRRHWFYVIGTDKLSRPAPKINRILRDTTRKIAKSAHKAA